MLWGVSAVQCICRAALRRLSGARGVVCPIAGGCARCLPLCRLKVVLRLESAGMAVLLRLESAGMAVLLRLESAGMAVLLRLESAGMAVAHFARLVLLCRRKALLRPENVGMAVAQGHVKDGEALLVALNCAVKIALGLVDIPDVGVAARSAMCVNMICMSVCVCV